MDVFDEYLTENEEVVHAVSSEGGNYLGVTNKRIIKLGNHDFKDVRYGHISSIGWETTSNFDLLVRGILLIIGAVVLWILNFPEIFELPEAGKWIFIMLIIVFVIAGSACLLVYFLTKKGELTIATENEKLTYPFKGSKSHTSVKDVIKTIRTLDESYYSK